MAVPPDYDADPERFRLGSRLTQRHLAGRSLYDTIADRLARRGASRVLDIGCGEGALRASLPSSFQLVGLDASATMLRAHPAPALQGEAAHLPFKTGAFDAAVAANVLYHLADPLPALKEARRVIAPGGLFVAATISRHDSPELSNVWKRAPTSFDAEDAPALVAEVFAHVEVERWDAPLITLPDEAAVRDYLVVRQVPPADAAARARRVPVPVSVTKRGALILATGETT